MLFVNVAFYLSIMFVDSFGCIPIKAIWDVTVPGKCINHKVSLMMGASFNSLSDICILIMPQRAIWNMESMSWKKKWGLSALFLLGIT